MQEVFNKGGGNIEDALLNLVQFYQKAVGDTLAIKKVSELMSKIMFFQSLFNFVETAGPTDAGFIMENFLTRLVDSVKDAQLNRIKRSALLYKVIDAMGMSPQQLMADITKIKKELK